MQDVTIISADSHVMEPPDLWTKHIDPAFAEQAPRLVPEEGGDWWYAGGIREISVAAGVMAGIKYRPEEGDWRFRSYEARWDGVREGAYNPRGYLEDLDLDGVAAGIVYPTIGLRHFYKIGDPPLFSAVCDGYNRWLAEFCGHCEGRVLGIGMVNVDDIESGVTQLERAADLGLRGAMITVYPPEERPYGGPGYERFWAKASELAMPLSLHLGTERPMTTTLQPEGSPTASAFRVEWTQRSLARMIFAGVFERWPDLKVTVVEQDLGWAAFFIDIMDRTYKHRVWQPGFHRYQGDALPSDFFHRNVTIAFQDDRLGVELRSHIGVNNIMWGNDYPHADGTFPHTREVLETLFDGVPQSEVAQIIGGNAAALYGIAAEAPSKP